MKENTVNEVKVWTWEWQVTCGLCGFKSRFYRSHKIARARAIIHAIRSHIFGHTTIAARERKT